MRDRQNVMTPQPIRKVLAPIIWLRKTLPMLVILLLVYSVNAGAIGKITTDPNVPGGLAEKPAPEKDERIAQKVTYSAGRKIVCDILSELSEATGIVFRAGYNSKDWQVRDRKMTIYAKDTPVSALMDSIARVMKFKWECSEKNGVWSYRLYMDRKTLLDAEAQRQREEDRLTAQQVKARQDVLNRFSGVEALSAQDLEKLKSDNPFLYVLAQSGFSNSMDSFLREAPFLAEAMVSGQPLTVQLSDLSTTAQNSFLKLMQSAWKLPWVSGNKANAHPDELADGIGNLAIQLTDLEELRSRMKGTSLPFPFLLDMNINSGSQGFSITLPNPENNYAKYIGRCAIESDEQQRPFRDVCKDHESDEMAAITSDMQKGSFEEHPKEPPTERPDDPDLQTEVKYEADGQRLRDVQAALAKASGFAVVSDNFNSDTPIGGVSKMDAELKDVLDKIGKAYFYNWDKQGSVIEFCDKNWFSKRAAQIPEEWLEKWKQELKKTDTLDIESLSEIAMLSFEQIRVNVRTDDILKTDVARMINKPRCLLQFYASLNQSQKSKLFVGNGLDFSTLQPDQLARVRKLLVNGETSLLDSNIPLALVGIRKAVGKQFLYDFSLITGDGPTETRWQFTTPRYTRE